MPKPKKIVVAKVTSKRVEYGVVGDDNNAKTVRVRPTQRKVEQREGGLFSRKPRKKTQMNLRHGHMALNRRTGTHSPAGLSRSPTLLSLPMSWDSSPPLPPTRNLAGRIW